jgi:hypothetical protein
MIPSKPTPQRVMRTFKLVSIDALYFRVIDAKFKLQRYDDAPGTGFCMSVYGAVSSEATQEKSYRRCLSQAALLSISTVLYSCLVISCERASFTSKTS